MNRFQQSLLIGWVATFLMVPFDLSFLNMKSTWTTALWSSIFQRMQIPYTDFSSDTPELVGLTLCLWLIFTTLVYTLHLKQKTWFETLSQLSSILFDWIIVLVFVKYGLDKILLLQFPQPEVNLLYMPLGEFDKDILFWSAIGSAPIFSIITGTIELIGAALLVFPKTKILGRYVLIGTLSIVLIIDISFDIHVVLLVSFLLLGLVIRSWTSIKFLFHALFGFEKNRPFGFLKRTLIFNSLAFLSLISITYLDNLPEEIVAESWVGAYQSLDKQKQLFINKQGFWIEQNVLDSASVYKIVQSKADLMLLDHRQGQKLVQLEDFGKYIHIKELRTNEWLAYKKLTKY